MASSAGVGAVTKETSAKAGLLHNAVAGEQDCVGGTAFSGGLVLAHRVGAYPDKAA